MESATVDLPPRDEAIALVQQFNGVHKDALSFVADLRSKYAYRSKSPKAMRLRAVRYELEQLQRDAEQEGHRIANRKREKMQRRVQWILDFIPTIEQSQNFYSQDEDLVNIIDAACKRLDEITRERAMAAYVKGDYQTMNQQFRFMDKIVGIVDDD